MISYLGIGFSCQAVVNYNIADLFGLVGFALPGMRLQVKDFGDSVAETEENQWRVASGGQEGRHILVYLKDFVVH
jgi:hypothetical protein